MLGCCSSGADGQSAICRCSLPVVGVVLHDVVGFHAVVKHRHQQLVENKVQQGSETANPQTKTYVSRRSYTKESPGSLAW